MTGKFFFCQFRLLTWTSVIDQFAHLVLWQGIVIWAIGVMMKRAEVGYVCPPDKIKGLSGQLTKQAVHNTDCQP